MTTNFEPLMQQLELIPGIVRLNNRDAFQFRGYTASGTLSVTFTGKVRLYFHYKRDVTRTFNTPAECYQYIVKRCKEIAAECDAHDATVREIEAQREAYQRNLAERVTALGLPAPDQWGGVVIPWMPPVHYSNGTSDPFSLKVYLDVEGRAVTEVIVGGCRAFPVPLGSALDFLKPISKGE